jgi:hypothetical protein
MQIAKNCICRVLLWEFKRKRLSSLKAFSLKLGARALIELMAETIATQ